MSERVRVGIIGLGMGRNHAIGFRDCPEATVVSLCDQDEERCHRVAAEVHPWRTTGSVEEILADPDIDAVAIALPNRLHASVAIEAFNRGKHVLCEKPLAMDAAEAGAMLEAARSADRTLMVHFNYRFQPASRAIWAAVQAGTLGEIYFSRSVWHRTRGIPGMGGWFTRRESSGGGALIDLGVHRLDLALWLMGHPRPVSVSGSCYDHLGRQQAEREGKTFDVDDLAAAYIRFEGGATLVLESSWASNSEKREDQSTQLFGTRGGAVMRNWDEGYQYEARLFLDRESWVEAVVPEYPTVVESAQQHFCRSILSGTIPIGSGAEGLMVMRILDAIYESAQSGREVRLDAA